MPVFLLHHCFNDLIQNVIGNRLIVKLQRQAAAKDCVCACVCVRQGCSHMICLYILYLYDL